MFTIVLGIELQSKMNYISNQDHIPVIVIVPPGAVTKQTYF